MSKDDLKGIREISFEVMGSSAAQLKTDAHETLIEFLGEEERGNWSFSMECRAESVNISTVDRPKLLATQWIGTVTARRKHATHR